MSSSSDRELSEVRVVSKFGPIRIELLDQKLNRIALGFGELRERVPAGLYVLHYSAGTAHKEEIVRAEQGLPVNREPELLLPSSAPIGVSSSAHEFHIAPAIRLSLMLQKKYGVGSGLVILVRTIDGDGRASVPIERLSLWNAKMREVGNLTRDAKRNKNEGWACLSARVNPGGYALRWQMVEGSSGGKQRGGQLPVDQSLWAASGWLTLVFIGYSSLRGQLERQSTSIHMARLGEGFHPGPKPWEIRENRVSPGELREAKVNQALDMVLGGLRTGNVDVPDDLLDLLLHAKFQNPMLGIVGAHAVLQRRTKDWRLFDVVVQNLHKLVPGHPDVVALRLLGKLMRDQATRTKVEPLSWPPMVYAGYRGLIARNWLEHHIVQKGSLAERAAAQLLPESPWSCWFTLKPQTAATRAAPGTISPYVNWIEEQPADPNTVMGVSLRNFVKGTKRPLKSMSTEQIDEFSDPAVRRVSQYLASLNQLGESVDPSTISLESMRQIGLPFASVERAIRVLVNAAGAEQSATGVDRTTAPRSFGFAENGIVTTKMALSIPNAAKATGIAIPSLDHIQQPARTRRDAASKMKRKRRTKGPSDKIRSLVAISLASKVGYLKLSDLTGQDEAAQAAVDKLPKRNFKAGDTVYPTSSKRPVAAVVRSGRVNIVRTSASGNELDVKTVEAGTIFGDMPMLGQSMLGARAVAADAAKVSYITVGDFEKIVVASPAVALNLARHIGPRLVDAERRHEQSAFQPVTARIASLLLKLAGGSKEVSGYTHQEMAEKLGVYRETVTKGIAELKQDGLIKVGRKRIALQNIDALRKLKTI